MAQAIKTWTHQPNQRPIGKAHIKLIQRFVTRAYQEQDDIGWENLFRGYITSQWGQTTFEHMTYQQRYTRAHEFNKKAITAILEYTEAIWAKRNDILHADTAETEAITHARVNAQIKEIYTNKEFYNDHERQFFKIPKQFILRRPLRAKRRWLFTVQPIVDRAQKRSTRSTQTTINTYLPTKNKPTKTNNQQQNKNKNNQQYILPSITKQKTYRQTNLRSEHYFTITNDKMNIIPE